MNKNFLASVAGLLAAGAAVAVVLLARQPETPAPDGAAVYFDPSAAAEDRIRALEAAVAEERNARMLLEEELQALYDAVEALGEDRHLQPAEQPASAVSGPREQFSALREQRRADQMEQRLSRLIDAGFAEDRAEWILRRESELQLEQMQALYEARQAGERADRFDPRMNPEKALRAEIGDAQYEQYLDAYGRSTSVAVGTVLESSPGQRAGLQPGDEIVAYGGERVFSYADLYEQTMNAAAGQPVVVDIVRNGMPMQVVIDGGPIGIYNGGLMRPGRR